MQVVLPRAIYGSRRGSLENQLVEVLCQVLDMQHTEYGFFDLSNGAMEETLRSTDGVREGGGEVIFGICRVNCWRYQV